MGAEWVMQRTNDPNQGTGWVKTGGSRALGVWDGGLEQMGTLCCHHWGLG